MPYNVLMPPLGSDMTEAKLSRWLKQEGDHVESGDVIAEAETDKATLEIEAAHSGVLTQILAPANSPGIKVGQVIAIVVNSGDADAVQTREPSSTIAMSPPQSAAANTSSYRLDQNNSAVFASPLARRIARENNIDIASIVGTGPNNRILVNDVQKAVEVAATGNNENLPAPPCVTKTSSRLLPLSTMRRIGAERLLLSKQTVPHYYITKEVEIDRLLALRAELNLRAASDPNTPRVSLNDMLIKSVATTLKENSSLNVSYAEDALRAFDDIDISVAVATDNGLITPIIRRADTKGLLAIATEMRQLAQLAKAGRLKPDQYQGGGFSISNLGMFGIDSFSAIINPPQAAILAVGRAIRKPTVDADDNVVVKSYLACTLSLDHRAADGVVGAAWLSDLAAVVESAKLGL